MEQRETRAAGAGVFMTAYRDARCAGATRAAHARGRGAGGRALLPVIAGVAGRRERGHDAGPVALAPHSAPKHRRSCPAELVGPGAAPA